MATKDLCLSYVDNYHQTDDCISNHNLRFGNLNLNRNLECLDLNLVQTGNISFNKTKEQKNGYFEYDNSESKLSKNHTPWNKSDKTLFTSKPFDSLNNYGEEILNENSLCLNNSSTLSLHISAYENSFKASNLNSEEKDSRIVESKTAIKKAMKDSKQLFTVSTTSKIQDPFEFPRQQNDVKREPEIMQFQASQKLLDSKESNSTRAKEESNEKYFPRKRLNDDSRSSRSDSNQRRSDDAVPAKRVCENQNSLPANIMEIIEIPNNVVGLVIGRGGDQIQAIQQETGCRVQMAGEATPQQSRHCTLNGNRENIERAKYMINEVISRSSVISNGYNMVQLTPYQQQQQQAQQQQSSGPTTPTPGGGIPPGCVQRILSIPGTKCGLIIGRNGETIKSLQETLGVKMLLIQENQAISHGPKPLRITGTPDKVENACRTIESIINSEDGRPQYAKSVGEVIVPRSSVGIIIGKSGETIKRLINESGCKIQFKPDEDPNTPDRCATLQGTPDQIARATQMISDLLQRSQNSGVTETFLMHVPANKTGLVIGKGGDTIKQICGESGAHVELSRDPPPNASEKIFVIKGSPYQIHHAQHIIRIKVGDIPPGTPVPHFSGSTSGGATAVPAANPYGAGFDGYNQWQQNGAYTTSQTDANQWSNYYQQQQQQQPQAVSAYTNAAVYASGGATATPATVASTQQQASGGAPVQDYSAQWAEYYRQMGMHEKAALVEEQAKKQQTSSTSQASGYGTGSYN